jgi:plastocyanin
MHKSILTFIAVPVLALGLAACGSSSKNSGSSSTTSAPASASITSGAQITIDSGFVFHTTAVKAGDTVTVKNDSTSQHTVTADGAGGFNVTIDAGKTATFTAPAAGTYPFHCNIHNFMKGTLTVS